LITVCLIKEISEVITVKKATKNMTLSAMFLALGLVLPFLTGQIPQIGSMLLPMHIPVMLCGLICGWQYGAVVGFIMPLLRSALFGAPVMFPAATAMAFELMTYGLVAGLMYGLSRWQCIVALYRSLIVAMLAGRAVWGVVQVIQLGFSGSEFTWAAFMSGAFLNAVPGIVIQLILIPAIMAALNRTGLVPYKKRNRSSGETESNL
jgi:thiamine transporter ThiT